jgi:4-hydroxybenzoate polyprenyltransferase
MPKIYPWGNKNMKNFLVLIRPYGMLFLGFTPVFGAIANGEFDFFHLTLLLLIGILAHIFTFVQNDYYDIWVDSKSRYVSNRPLVTGGISKKKAFLIFFSSFIISIFIATIFFFTIYSLSMLLLSFLFMTLYNKYSKRFFAMEYILGAGVFTYGLFGALTVSNNVSYFVIIVSAIGFLQWLFSVGISANLKDVEFDTKHGIRTTPTVFGVHMDGQKLLISGSFWVYAFFVKILHILVVSLPFILGYTSIFIYGLPIPGICFIILSIVSLYLTMKILSTPITNRDKILIYVGLQEGFALLLIPIALTSYIAENTGIIPIMLLILLFIFWPLFWFRILYGKKMIPLE